MEKETRKTEIFPMRPNWLWIPAMGEDGLIGGADSAFQEARDYITWLESTDNGQVLAKLVELQDVCYTLLGRQQCIEEYVDKCILKEREKKSVPLPVLSSTASLPPSVIGHDREQPAPQPEMPNCTKPDGMTLEKCHAFNSGKCMSEFQCKPASTSAPFHMGTQFCLHGHPHWEHCSFCEKEQTPAPRCPICGQELRWNGNLGYFFCGCLGFECCIVRLKPYETEEAAPVLAPNDIICHWNSFSADPAELCVMGWDESYRSLKCPDCKLPTCNNCFAHEDNAPHGCMGGGVCGLWSLYKE